MLVKGSSFTQLIIMLCSKFPLPQKQSSFAFISSFNIPSFLLLLFSVLDV